MPKYLSAVFALLFVACTSVAQPITRTAVTAPLPKLNGQWEGLWRTMVTGQEGPLRLSLTQSGRDVKGTMEIRGFRGQLLSLNGEHQLLGHVDGKSLIITRPLSADLEIDGTEIRGWWALIRGVIRLSRAADHAGTARPAAISEGSVTSR